MENEYEYDYNNSTSDTFHYEDEIPSHPPSVYFNPIRLSIFFIAAVCVGLPCLIWAFYLVHLQRKTRGRISAFIILLLLSDLLQLLLYPYIVSKLFSFTFFSGLDTVIMGAGYVYLKICSLHLQQLVVLEGVLTLKYPLISAHIFSSPCYTIISIIVLLFSLMCVLLLVFSGPHGGPHGLYLGFGSIMAPVFLLVVAGIIIFKAPPTPASTPATDNRPGALLFLVNMVNLVLLYLPSVLVFCVQIFLFHISMSLYIMSHCLLSLTVISEPLLCVLVCRENLSTQTKQTHIELNSEQTAV